MDERLVIDHLRADLERDLSPADYRRTILRYALIETLGFAREDATSYVDGVRLSEMPKAKTLVDRRFGRILAGRLG